MSEDIVSEEIPAPNAGVAEGIPVTEETIEEAKVLKTPATPLVE